MIPPDCERQARAGGIARPDPDGFYRVEDFFCHDDTWRITVSRLALESHAVLMDLRGFNPAKRGCVFEIEQLIASVPLDRVVLLIDQSSDVGFLQRTMREAWGSMPGGSPNAGAGRHAVRILRVSSSHGRTLDTLLRLLCASFDDAASPARHSLRQDGAAPAVGTSA